VDATVKDVLKVLQGKDLDVSQLMEFHAEKMSGCKIVRRRRNGAGNGNLSSAILDILGN